MTDTKTSQTAESPAILLVDDDDVFLRQLARAFTRRGFDVRTATDHDGAVASASADAPPLAVVDLRMGEDSGMDTLRALLTIDPEMRVVVLTGYGSIASAVEATKLGATNFVSKPADVDDILAAFEKGERPNEAVETRYQAPSLARAEWEHINRVLADCGGNISETARRLGIHRRTLQRKLQTYPPKE